MKKLFLLSFVLAAFLFSFNVNAQDSQFRVSAGMAYGTKADVDTNNGGTKGGIGINIGAEYLFNEQFSIAPSYTMFFASDPLDLSAINIDGRYYFSMDATEVYGLLGYGSLKASTSVLGVTVSDTEGGLNFGGGANFGLSDKLKINTQAKYTTAGDGQLVINAGLVIGF